MIEVTGLTRRYGTKTAVDDVTFTVEPGRITGFVGPNGSGKSTTMRLILGLEAPTRGTATVNGRPYREHPAPLTQAGALLDMKVAHPGRSAYSHLLSIAQTHGISRSRVEETIELVGLGDVAKQRVGKFSLGMNQRLGLAVALLGDPHTLILDEPLNGLDPQGIRWVRSMLVHLAAGEGKTILVSSHLISEMALTADDLVIIGRGRLIAQTTVADCIASATRNVVFVSSPQSADLQTRLIRAGAQVQPGDESDRLEVQHLSALDIGKEAAAAGIVLSELSAKTPSLEDAFFELTDSAVEYRGTGSGGNAAASRDQGTLPIGASA